MVTVVKIINGVSISPSLTKKCLAINNEATKSILSSSYSRCGVLLVLPSASGFFFPGSAVCSSSLKTEQEDELH